MYLIREKLSFYWSSEHHSELSPHRKECLCGGSRVRVANKALYHRIESQWPPGLNLFPHHLHSFLGVKAQSDSHYSSKKIDTCSDLSIPAIYIVRPRSHLSITATLCVP